jgi:Arylsulfotransferase (ASST)
LTTIRLTAPFAILLMCVGVCACGDTGSSRAAASALTPTADRAEAHANPVAVSPLPGTEDASPTTQISFLGEAGTTVADVSVVGSHSGNHPGKLKRYSTGTGESFVPNTPFQAGEQVAVHALVGEGSAAPEKPVTSVFTVAHQASVSQVEFPNNPGDPHAVQHYASAPTLTPSTVTITTHAKPGAAPGDLFMAPYQGKGTPGPMIAEEDGTLVWFHPLPAGEESTDFEVQQYEGKPALTWWQGRILKVGFGQGEDVVYNSSYKRIASVRAGNGYRADLHQFRLTPQGTAWIDEFDPIKLNMASLHGAGGVLTDSVVQEIDVKTGLVMWEWHALGHIPLSDSYNPIPHNGNPWDYIHVNSIDPGSSNDVLVSARNSWALYDVDIKTGAFNWQLGGQHSTFKLGSGAKTYWQHDAEWQPRGLISVFDNGSTPPREKQSRGVLLKPNFAARTVALAQAFVNPSRTLLAPAQGNTLALAGGDWLMGYGNLPNFTEYDPAGHVLLDGTLGHNVQDFRTYLSPSWSGKPETVPAIVAKRSGASVAVQMSWNGATDVASWKLLAGSSPSLLVALATVPKHGFQTTATVTTSAPYVESWALDANGNELGASAAAHVG